VCFLSIKFLYNACYIFIHLRVNKSATHGVSFESTPKLDSSDDHHCNEMSKRYEWILPNIQRSVFCFNVCYTYNYVLGFWTLLKISCYWRNSPRSTLFFDCAILLMQMFNFWAFLGRRMMKTYFQQINWIM